MKKLIILESQSNSLGGVWFFNKALGEALEKEDFQVDIVALRKVQDKNINIDTTLNLHTINPNKCWLLIRKKDVIEQIKNLHFLIAFSFLLGYFNEKKSLKEDLKKLQVYIKNHKPDYIIVSYYSLLYGIPKEYLKRTIIIQHSSLKNVLELKECPKVLKKYSKLVFKMIWLSKKTCEEANKFGFSNNFYMYNPVRFETSKIADVVKNKKLIAISRIENKVKRIDLMLEIVNNVLKDFPDWTFEIYGVGEFSKYGESILKENKQINYMGETNNPEAVLLTASINLNTSKSEGFSLSILEAYMCGLPTVAFDFGESTNEEIINNETGYIIKNDNKKEYEKKLAFLMNNQEELLKMSQNSKKFVSNFTIEKITSEWLELFKKLDKDVENEK